MDGSESTCAKTNPPDYGECVCSVMQMGVVWRLRAQRVEGTWVTFSRARASQPPPMHGTASTASP